MRLLSLKRFAGTGLLVSLLLLAAGCANNYDISLRGGSTIRSTVKPVLNERGEYVFKDATGRVGTINRSKVWKIEAVHPGSKSANEFN